MSAAAEQPKGYVIVELEVFDPALFGEYRSAVAKMIADYGGRYLARGGTTQGYEGDLPPSRCILLEFPSLEIAQSMLDAKEYGPIAAIRHKSAKSRIYLVEGYNP